MDKQKNSCSRCSQRSPLYPRMASPRHGCGDREGMSCKGAGIGESINSCNSCNIQGKPPKGCGFESPYGCKFPSLAMVYPAPQAWEKIYSPTKALQRGTAFTSLDLPFSVGKGCCK